MISVFQARTALNELIDSDDIEPFIVLSKFITQSEQLINAQKAKTPALLREIENVYE